MKKSFHELCNDIRARIVPHPHTRAESDAAYHDAQIILEYLTGLSTAHLIAAGAFDVTPETHKRLDEILTHITKHRKPLAYIIGTVRFLDLELTIKPPVLIPRSETESWCAQTIEDIAPFVARAADTQNPFTIVDVCTGSGCIALALATRFAQENIRVIGIDDAEHALACARENARRNGIKKCTFVRSNLFDRLPDRFACDLIVSNPPYIGTEEYDTLDPSVKNWEDPHALFAGSDGLDVIQRIIASAPAYLRTKYGCGELRCEIGHTQAHRVRMLFEKNRYTSIGELNDINGIPRVIYGKSTSVQ